MTLTTIEKAAKLLGHDLSKVTGTHPHLGLFIDEGPEFRQWFNPYTNKADLMDVECTLGIDIEWFDTVVMAYKYGTGINVRGILADHPNKFTARAHAVMAVVEQIYDRREG
jgi:hypothetical protein